MMTALASLILAAAMPLSLQLTPPQVSLQTCLLQAQPFGWRDASDPMVFAMHPLAWHDMEESAAANLAPLVNLGLDGSRLRLFLLGAPAVTQRRLTLRWAGPHTGWTLRWPFCAPGSL